MIKRHIHLFIAALLVVGLTACGGESAEETGSGGATAASSELSDEELRKGIGPVSNVSLTDDVDAALAARGEEIYNSKCSACHKMEQRYVGPPLGDVTERREPEFVMNMMLNPEEMIRSHPEGKAMLAEYLTTMPNQQLSEDDARAILEYLRPEAR